MPAPETAASGNPLVTALLQGNAPRLLKLSAARGVLPLARGDLVRILVLLAGDQDPEIGPEAVARLAALPHDEVLPLLADPATSPEVLDHFAGGEPSGEGDPSGPASRAAWREAILGNPATSTATIRRLAPRLAATQIDLLLLNLTLLIATPDLLDAIAANPSATPLQQSRIAEIRKHFLAPKQRPEPPAAALSGEPSAETRTSASPLSASAPTPAPPAPEPQSASDEPPDAAGEEAAAAAVMDNVNQRILRMNTAEKIQLAMKGSREERSILIKDSSRVVQQAVLESPKLTENEVESIAKMRSVAEDVLRTISGHRDWMKNYTVIHALTTNPKTPVGIAINLVSRLNSRDLKIVVSDKNVPEVIRRQARKVTDSRNQGVSRPRSS